jgi:type VI secretion system protein ImpA
MKNNIDIKALLMPIAGDNPAGADLRYAKEYDEIKETRREKETFGIGGQGYEVKRADWNKVITLCTDALLNKTKDLQVAAWLTEALVRTDGFEGLSAGLRITSGLMGTLWSHIYPPVEDNDLEYRSGPLEFMNEKLSFSVKQISLTDPKKTPGYSLIQFQESRQVGYEKDLVNQYGDVNEGKKNTRMEMIAEGKITAEDFDSAVNKTMPAFYEALAAKLAECRKEFDAFSHLVDEKFGRYAPRLAELQEALEAHERLGFLARYFKKEDVTESASVAETEAAASEAKPAPEEEGMSEPEQMTASHLLSGGRSSGFEAVEKAMWQESLKKLKDGGVKAALDQLYNASGSMPSIREKTRYRLLMAKLCLKGDRPDLARPIVEELYAMIEEFHLAKWESPMWIAEVFEAFYQCLSAGNPSDEDRQRANELFKKMCTLDVTKAMIYRQV